MRERRVRRREAELWAALLANRSMMLQEMIEKSDMEYDVIIQAIAEVLVVKDITNSLERTLRRLANLAG